MAKEEQYTGTGHTYSPVHGTMPDPFTCQCGTCKFRDYSKITMRSGLVVPIGVVKSFCKVFQPPPRTNGKPHEVLYNFIRCPYYRMETR